MTDLTSLLSCIELRRENQMRAVRAALEALLVRGQSGVVLADEVGCGKTYEALATAALLWRSEQKPSEARQWRILIVADGALSNKWVDELEHDAKDQRGFAQYIDGAEWKGFQSIVGRPALLRDWDGRFKRDSGKLQLPPNGLYVARPHLLMQKDDYRVRRILATSWDLLIIDEAHHFARLRNKRGQIFFPTGEPESRNSGLSARFTLALTATPFQLSTREMLNLFRLIKADDEDVSLLGEALPKYERALAAFHDRRNFAPDDPARTRWVARLEAMRSVDCTGNGEAGAPTAPGLQQILRKYLLRSVKSSSTRKYFVTERNNGHFGRLAFDKLDDLRPKLSASPLIAFDGNHALAYLELRDLVQDTVRAARENVGTATFVAGDLRQALSSYEQLEKSSLMGKSLPRVQSMRRVLSTLSAAGARHPKVDALVRVVGALVSREIEEARAHPGQHLHKILVFNTLVNRTADVLKDALEAEVERLVHPYVLECLQAAGFSDEEDAKERVREALRRERESARARLLERYEPRHLVVTPELLEEAGLNPEGETQLVDALFKRAEHHATQPLFLLRLATAARTQELELDEYVDFFVMRRVAERLLSSIDRIVDDCLDDTPLSEDELENHWRAVREIRRVARILARPEYVGRFDGGVEEDLRETRKENFNRPYAPLVLLVSKVGEEGIDLQAHTRYVLHYDVEWNPAKMEQREGRVDREGRRDGAPVHVQFFLLKDTYEERIFHTVMQRDAWFQILIGSKRQELAGNVEEDPSEDSNLEITEESGRLTPEERRRVMIELQP